MNFRHIYCALNTQQGGYVRITSLIIIIIIIIMFIIIITGYAYSKKKANC